MPVTIVEVDQKSLAALGQWPWPRPVLAQLIRDINRHRPAAIGIDILMPEADGLSLERLLARTGNKDPVLATQLAALSAHDAELARTLAAAPTVLPIVGSSEATGMLLRAPPFSVSDVSARAGPTEMVARGLPQLHGRIDEPRPARPRRVRPRTHFGRAGGRGRSPHPARRERGRNAGACAGDRDAAGRLRRAVAATPDRWSVGGGHRGRQVHRADRGGRRRARLLFAEQQRPLHLGGRRPRRQVRTAARSSGSWC